MDWNLLTGVAAITASWMFCWILGMNIGIRLERFRWTQKEEVFFDEMPKGDTEYWRGMYTELAEEWAAIPNWLLNEIDRAREQRNEREKTP